MLKLEEDHMNEEKRTVHLPHNIVLNDRKNLSVTGVGEVLGCDEEVMTVKTSNGELTITGSGLHIGSFNRGTGELKVDGRIKELIYSDAQPRQSGFFKRLFK